jgi:hypothetical protein
MLVDKIFGIKKIIIARELISSPFRFAQELIKAN